VNTWDLGNNEEHQRLRDLLGSYTLGHLGEADEAMVRAHLDGCAACRADLEEIAPLGAMLDLVDARHFDLPALPPGDLGAAIRDQVAGEREQLESDEVALARARARRRTAWRAGLGAAAAIVVLVALEGGVLIGRSTAPGSTAPTPPPATVTVTEAPPSVTLEPVTLSGSTSRIKIATSGLVAHTWGVELRMSGKGFAKGDVFEAAFRDKATGEFVTAGAFIGTGRNEMTCNLQSALMRAEATEVVVMDADGEIVLTAPL